MQLEEVLDRPTVFLREVIAVGAVERLGLLE